MFKHVQTSSSLVNFSSTTHSPDPELCHHNNHCIDFHQCHHHHHPDHNQRHHHHPHHHYDYNDNVQFCSSEIEQATEGDGCLTDYVATRWYRLEAPSSSDLYIAISTITKIKTFTAFLTKPFPEHQKSYLPRSGTQWAWTCGVSAASSPRCSWASRSFPAPPPSTRLA